MEYDVIYTATLRRSQLKPFLGQSKSSWTTPKTKPATSSENTASHRRGPKSSSAQLWEFPVLSSTFFTQSRSVPSCCIRHGRQHSSYASNKCNFAPSHCLSPWGLMALGCAWILRMYGRLSWHRNHRQRLTAQTVTRLLRITFCRPLETSFHRKIHRLIRNRVALTHSTCSGIFHKAWCFAIGVCHQNDDTPSVSRLTVYLVTSDYLCCFITLMSLNTASKSDWYRQVALPSLFASLSEVCGSCPEGDYPELELFTNSNKFWLCRTQL